MHAFYSNVVIPQVTVTRLCMHTYQSMYWQTTEYKCFHSNISVFFFTWYFPGAGLPSNHPKVVFVLICCQRTSPFSLLDVHLKHLSLCFYVAWNGISQARELFLLLFISLNWVRPKQHILFVFPQQQRSRWWGTGREAPANRRETASPASAVKWSTWMGWVARSSTLLYFLYYFIKKTHLLWLHLTIKHKLRYFVEK